MSDLERNMDSACPSLEAWDSFILSTRIVDLGLQFHLEHCPFCQVLVKERRKELDQLLEIMTEGLGAETAELEYPQVIHLEPWNPLGDNEEAVSSLAAQGEVSQELPQSITLASADQSIVLKVVRDSQSRDLWLYLLGDDPAAYRQYFVRPFGMDKSYLIDSQGRINLGQIDFPDSQNYLAEVHTPRAVFSLTPFVPAGLEEERMLESPQGDKIRVRYTTLGQSRQIVIEIVHLANLSPTTPLKIAVRGEGQKEITLVSPTSGTFAINDFPTSGSMEIYLFQ